MKAELWNSKYGTPYISFCEDNGTPIYSMAFADNSQRTEFMKINNIKGGTI